MRVESAQLYHISSIASIDNCIGLIVQRVYGSQKDFLVDCLSTKSALEQKFLFKNRELSVFEYMLEHYNLTLEYVCCCFCVSVGSSKVMFRYPKAPLIEAKFSGGRTDYFPMELVLVSDNQRVRSHQQTPLQTQQMIKVGVLPKRVYICIINLLDNFGVCN